MILQLYLMIPQFIRLILYSILLSVGSYLYDNRTYGVEYVQRLPFNLYLKRATSRPLLPEVHALKLVATHTTGDIAGKSLQLMNADQLRQFAIDFRNNVGQIRRILNPYSHLICGSSGGPCRDGRIDHEDGKSGTFHTFEDLHRYLVSIYALLKDHTDRSLIAEVHSRPHRVFFAHADLNPGNVLVHKGRLSSFVDWEYAGWYPEYWEHTKSCYIVHRWGLWLDTMGEVFPEYTDELKAQKIFQNYTCPF